MMHHSLVFGIAAGDVVSQPDGPPMTVNRVDGDVVHCDWFVGTTLMRDTFRAQRLQRHER